MRALTIGGAMILILCAGGTRLDAQGVASTFDQLSVLVKPGDKISVVDAAGSEAEGRIGKLALDTLTLVTEAGPRQFGERDIAEIRQRRGDSLQNGAIIGAAAGAGYGVALLTLAAALGDGGGINPVGAVTGMLVFTGLGAAAGAGIDALIARRQVIYRRSAPTSGVSISALVGQGRRGAAVTVRF